MNSSWIHLSLSLIISWFLSFAYWFVVELVSLHNSNQTGYIHIFLLFFVSFFATSREFDQDSSCCFDLNTSQKYFNVIFEVWDIWYINWWFGLFGFMAHQASWVIQCQIHFYTYKLLFQTIQFSISTVWMSNNSIWPMDRTLSGATILGLSGPGSNGNKLLHHEDTPSNKEIFSIP